MKEMTKTVTNCVKCGMRSSCQYIAIFMDDERSSALIYSALYAAIA